MLTAGYNYVVLHFFYPKLYLSSGFASIIQSNNIFAHVLYLRESESQLVPQINTRFFRCIIFARSQVSTLSGQIKKSYPRHYSRHLLFENLLPSTYYV